MDRSQNLTDVCPESPLCRGFHPQEVQHHRTVLNVDDPMDFPPLQTSPVTNLELQKKCKVLGLPTTGNKRVLIDRITQSGSLQDSLQNDAFSPVQNDFHFEKADISLLRISYGSWFQIAETFISLLKSVTDRNDLPSWNNLLAFGRACLCQPLNSKENKKKSLSFLVKCQCLAFNAG